MVDPGPAVARAISRRRRFRRRSSNSSRRGWISGGRRKTVSPRRIAANIAHSVEAVAAFQQWCAVGWPVRTEMLYMDRLAPPSEDGYLLSGAGACRQAQHYYCRTMDIGGDKPVAYLNIPAENNPFLSYPRGAHL